MHQEMGNRLPPCFGRMSSAKVEISIKEIINKHMLMQWGSGIEYVVQPTQGTRFIGSLLHPITFFQMCLPCPETLCVAIVALRWSNYWL